MRKTRNQLWGLGMGLFLIVLLAYATESPFTSCIIFSISKNSYKEPGFKYMWKKNPSPACTWSYPACHLPGEKQQWLCKQKAVFSRLLKSPAIDQGKTSAFQKLPQKGTEPAQLPRVTGAVYIRGFSGTFSRAGSPRRDPGRISPLSDSRSHIMGTRAGFNILHFSTLIHATPGE